MFNKNVATIGGKKITYGTYVAMDEGGWTMNKRLFKSLHKWWAPPLFLSTLSALAVVVFIFPQTLDIGLSAFLFSGVTSLGFIPHILASKKYYMSSVTKSRWRYNEKVGRMAKDVEWILNEPIPALIKSSLHGELMGEPNGNFIEYGGAKLLPNYMLTEKFISKGGKQYIEIVWKESPLASWNALFNSAVEISQVDTSDEIQ